jgi:hypothetical protein
MIGPQKVRCMGFMKPCTCTTCSASWLGVNLRPLSRELSCHVHHAAQQPHETPAMAQQSAGTVRCLCHRHPAALATAARSRGWAAASRTSA